MMFAPHFHPRFHSGYMELRWKSKDASGFNRKFFSVDDQAAINGEIDRLAREGDVYYGVLRRTGKDGRAAACAPSRMAWAELDDPASIERAMNFKFTPNFVVETSPGKAHAYFDLCEEIDPKYQRQMNLRLAHHFGGDKNACDAARILRPCGTLNHKYGEPHPVRCVFVSIAARMPTARELVGDLPDPEPPRATVSEIRPREVTSDDPLHEIPASEYVSVLTGRAIGVDGKVRCPFHKGGQERTPSLHAYGDPQQGWFCWGCDAGGDLYNFAARLYGLDSHRDFPEIRRRLLADLSRAVA